MRSESLYERVYDLKAELKHKWNWYWYYRHGKIKFHVLDFGDYYKASASNGEITVWNCYGSTKKAAKEMASYRLQKAINEHPRF